MLLTSNFANPSASFRVKEDVAICCSVTRDMYSGLEGVSSCWIMHKFVPVPFRKQLCCNNSRYGLIRCCRRYSKRINLFPLLFPVEQRIAADSGWCSGCDDRFVARTAGAPAASLLAEKLPYSDDRP